jgi:hypothetical protein
MCVIGELAAPDPEALARRRSGNPTVHRFTSIYMQIHSENGTLWPTPTLTLTLQQAQEFNSGLARIILEEEHKIIGKTKPQEVAGIKDGLSSYWLKFNVLNWNYPEVEEFRAIVLSGLRQWFSMMGDPDAPRFQIAGISCWANVLRCGEGIAIHHHDPAIVSAHYTVQSGLDGSDTRVTPDSGYTIYFRPGFLDRSHGGRAAIAPSPWDEDWRLESPPREGRLHFFPSFVRHEVRPYLGPTERISIAMDVFLKCQALPIYFGGPRWFIPA